MRPGELWDPPRASGEHREYVIESLDVALNMSRIDPFVVDLMAESEVFRESNLHCFDPAAGVIRVSGLLIDQLAESYTVGPSHMHGIMDAIKMLEGTGTRTNAKPATLFMRAPLRGLWHQHYVSAAFLAKNLENELDEMGGGVEAVERRIEEIARDTSLTEPQKHIQLNQLAYDLSWGAYKTRSEEQRMTGEWVVFAKDDTGTNHYLTAANHIPTRKQQALLDLIRARCEPRFVALLP